MFQFLDEELPNQNYKEVVLELHKECSTFGKPHQFKHDEETQNEIVKIMEDLNFYKVKNQVVW